MIVVSLTDYYGIVCVVCGISDNMIMLVNINNCIDGCDSVGCGTVTV